MKSIQIVLGVTVTAILATGIAGFQTTIPPRVKVATQPCIARYEKVMLQNSHITQLGMSQNPIEDTKEGEKLPVAADIDNVKDKIDNTIASTDDKPYPVDLPSPVLLASSIVLAIASVGSTFEIIEGKAASSAIGGPGSLAIAIIGVPTTLFLFYAAIAKAQYETAQDDEQFVKRNKK